VPIAVRAHAITCSIERRKVISEQFVDKISTIVAGIETTTPAPSSIGLVAGLKMNW